ncbi:MAG TPA: toprim domain-containing protein [bacterium]|nr:toprim domain-containing protein [bacterium]
MNESLINKIKENIDIIDLAKRLGLEVKHKQARCYNSGKHKNNDSNFSLGFYENNTKYKCFTCGVSGSVVDLYMGVKGVDLKTAVKELSDITGLSKPIITKSVEKNAKPLEALAEYCKGVDSETLKYLTGDRRGLTEETIARFKLFSIRDYTKTAEHLKKIYSKEELESIGLINDKGNLTFYKHKLVIPFYKNGELVFIQGRRIDDGKPKYINCSLPVVLFNRDKLFKLRKGATVYICEGVFDAMILEQYGLNAVAILGVQGFKPEWVKMFKELNTVLCLDNDKAGEDETKELVSIFLSNGVTVKTKELPEEFKDVTDYFLERKTK